MIDTAVVGARLAEIRGLIADAARTAGRAPEEIEILAATKYVEADDLPALAKAGVTLVGENRTDSLLAKQAAHGELFTWDFIGALQSRKARDLVGAVRLVHSLASLSAAEQLQARSSEDVRCLVEVNVAGEDAKAGVPAAELPAFLEALAEHGRLRVEGLMGMPPLAERPEDSRRHFAALRELAARHGLPRLSMGTSQDFAVAVEEGATVVRIGSTLYGRRAV